MKLLRPPSLVAKLIAVAAGIALLIGMAKTSLHDPSSFGFIAVGVAMVAVFTGFVLINDARQIVSRSRQLVARARQQRLHSRVYHALVHVLAGWSVLATAVPAAGSVALIYFSIDAPHSARWLDATTVPTPAGQTGPFIHGTQKWILLQNGEVWAFHESDTHAQPGPFPLGHIFESPMNGFAPGTVFSQDGARHDFAVDSRIVGFSLNWYTYAGRPPANYRNWSYQFICFPLWTFCVPLTVVLLRRILKEVGQKHQPGVCPLCSYDLRAHAPGNNCPECGTLISTPQLASPSKEATR